MNSVQMNLEGGKLFELYIGYNILLMWHTIDRSMSLYLSLILQKAS
jgi:hypothetical protein